MGNHWFPSVARAAFAEQLVKTAPHTKYAIFGAGGAEAVEVEEGGGFPDDDKAGGATTVAAEGAVLMAVLAR